MSHENTLIVILASSHASQFSNYPLQIHLLRPKSGSSGHHIHGVSCLSWRLAVETNNLVGWATVPEECENYVGHYMLGDQYRGDSAVITDAAFAHAKSFKLAGDGKDIWVFDVDETTLSNLPYYAEHLFGAEPYNSTAFNQWVFKGKAVALPESLKLYKKLLSIGIKVVFLTGRPEEQRAVTSTNLKNAGYHNWEKLILKSSSYAGKTAVFYKSSERAKLEKKGYRIIGNMGDQWSDLLGTNVGKRTFKLPDPMYYINMAYRGRGRGRGRFGGGSFTYARQEPFDLFPEVELPDPKDVKEERALVVWNSRLTNYFKSSPYYLEEIITKESQSIDIERFSDRGKPKITSERDSLDQFLQLTSKNFPKELIGGLKRKGPNKRVRWTAGLSKLDEYEKCELMSEEQGEKAQKEKKEDEDEEDEDEVAEEPDEDDDDGDYNQNIDFDDDEDDYNMEDDNDSMHLFSNMNTVSPISIDGMQKLVFLRQMLIAL
ncbi:unnamed protein product [Dovyalis caffra]|uniref:Acid phosphatase n=1 Tax=Dovyalis caffra TaxID=77055 RepID=A0AAV1SSM6_9ROSI|nr:unnamed protein product [Dovyalis caffra]